MKSELLRTITFIAPPSFKLAFGFSILLFSFVLALNESAPLAFVSTCERDLSPHERAI